VDGTQSSCQHVRRAPSDDFGRFTVSGGIIRSHFRREAGASRVAIDGWAHNNHRRQSGDQGPSLFPAGADQPIGHLPAPSRGIAELESQLCWAGGFGRSEHQVSAVVGVVLSALRSPDIPCLCCKILRSAKGQHQQLAQNGIIAQARATPPKRKYRNWL